MKQLLLCILTCFYQVIDTQEKLIFDKYFDKILVRHSTETNFRQRYFCEKVLPKKTWRVKR